MQTPIKVIAALIVAALIVVIGLIYLHGQNQQSDEITTTPEVAVTQDATIAPETSLEPELNENPTTEPDDASQEAQDEAQGDVYEGALAGMTEEEIEKQALAEEAMEGVHVETND